MKSYKSILIIAASLMLAGCPPSDPVPEEPDKPVRPARCTDQMANACVKDMQRCRDHYGPPTEATFCDQLKVCELQEIDIQIQNSSIPMTIKCQQCVLADNHIYTDWRGFYTSQFSGCQE